MNNAKGTTKKAVSNHIEGNNQAIQAPVRKSNQAAVESEHTVVRGTDKGRVISKEVVIGETVLLEEDGCPFNVRVDDGKHFSDPPEGVSMEEDDPLGVEQVIGPDQWVDELPSGQLTQNC